MKKYLLLLLTFIFCHYAYTQTGNIIGSVKTSDGKPAAYVNIGLKGTTKGASTNNEGYYEIKNVKEGTYTLIASFVGLKTQELQITVTAGQTTSVSQVVLEENYERLREVIVYGAQSNSYTTDIPSKTLRINTPLVEIPQNIQVIPQEVIEDQQSIDMLETVSRNVSGVQMIEHWGNFARINMRGFKIPAFRNGMNVEMPWGPLTEDMAIVERIEFVKGPAGFMLSSGEPGGLYNVVTKKPSRYQQKEVTLMMGSFNTLRSTVDVGGAFEEDGKLLYRLNLMGSTKGSHRGYEFNHRYTVAPSLRYEVSDKTSVSAEYIYQYSKMSVVGAAYVFSPTGFGDLPRDFTLAEPNIDPTDINEHNIFVTLNHQLSSQWAVTAQLGYLNYNQVGSSLWPESVEPNGDIIRGIGVWDALNESKLGQVFVNGEVKTGSIAHEILAGVDIGHKDYFADWFQGGPLAGSVPFNVYNPQHGVPSDSIPVFDRSRSIRKRAYGSYPAISGQRYSSLYAQDELSLFDNKVRLSLALRYTAYSGWTYGQSTDDDVLTPRVGLSISVAKNTSVYGLYDQSFIPQAGASFDGEAFEPVKAKNLEAGIKRSWFDGRWNSTLAVYQITKDNVLTGDPENPNFSIQLGQVQSKGFEFDVQGEVVKGLQVVLNYANTNVEVTEDTNEALIGTRVAGHSRHITNGWLHYRLPDNIFNGLGVSLGYQYQVDRSSWNWGADNESVLPDYFRLDGAVSWQNDDFNIAINVNNLLNEYLYSGSAYATYYYWQTEPGTNFRVNLAYKF
ncbi:TonB-dependent siderophore receptor [Fulvivirga imtechensis AK7]|uniref:TonB-dependent siderophore receptor n=1 Tax=Fulvivirga imtechensis AK7 TaxID=1237149 RepID=L8JKN3_9BACT|nr:TonB-dependent receptor [Fulvivirga imtechensis]ELR69491.1 TonB-dependent siderophore receptor [Fulvivirga imtechensis AK7]